MSATVITIATAVTSALNAATLSQAFTAERFYVPVIELKDLPGVQVMVVPRELSMAILSRRDDDFEYVVDIAVQKSIGQGQMTDAEVLAECDPLMQFVEEIVDLFRSETVKDSLFPARFMSATNVPIFAPERLDQLRVFTSVISLSFKQDRPRAR